MRFPWKRRADEAEEQRREAEKQFDQAQADWPEVRRHVEEMRFQREANGWTSIAAALFSGKQGR